MNLGLGASLAALPGLGQAAPGRPTDAPRLRRQLQRLLPPLMARHQVPGACVVLLRREPRMHTVLCLGRMGRMEREAGTGGAADAVRPDTVFEAASMSKPLFAVLLLQQVQAGRLTLDRPLLEFFPERFSPAQDWQALITPRLLLCHASGLPNWRSGDEDSGPLPLAFEPGLGRFLYSGEGFFYLQRALEHLLGESLQATAERQLFRPLGMAHSSFVLTPQIDALRARGHDEAGLALPWSDYKRGNAAYTLYTTAQDYARFLQALLRPGLLPAALLDEMLSPQNLAGDRQALQRPGMATDTRAHWGLGWILNPMQDGSQVAYHTGTNSSGFRAYSQFSRSRGSAMVMMSNGLGGKHLTQALAAELGDL